MRRLVSIPILCASLPVAAIAQETPSRSPEDYVCELTGECAADSEVAESETVGERGRARVSATRGFSLSRPANPGAKPATLADRLRFGHLAVGGAFAGQLANIVFGAAARRLLRDGRDGKRGT